MNRTVERLVLLLERSDEAKWAARARGWRERLSVEESADDRALLAREILSHPSGAGSLGHLVLKRQRSAPGPPNEELDRLRDQLHLQCRRILSSG